MIVDGSAPRITHRIVPVNGEPFTSRIVINVQDALPVRLEYNTFDGPWKPVENQEILIHHWADTPIRIRGRDLLGMESETVQVKLDGKPVLR